MIFPHLPLLRPAVHTRGPGSSSPAAGGADHGPAAERGYSTQVGKRFTGKNWLEATSNTEKLDVTEIMYIYIHIHMCI